MSTQLRGDASKIDLEAAKDCEACEGKGYLHIALDGNTSLDWIMRCDECQYWGQDNPRTAWDDDAAQRAALVEGGTVIFPTTAYHYDCTDPTQHPALVKDAS